MSKQNKQPLLQRPAVVGVLASLLSIVVGLVLGFVLLVLLNPGAAVGGMKAMLATGFSSMDKLGKVLYQAAPLMMCGLSVGFAFKTGLFNIGASGQYTMGAFFSLLCAIQFQLPWYVCLLAGAVGGAIWGVFPGLFKAYFNVNEVITAIMFNWIGMYLVNLLLANMPDMLASGWGASNSDRTAALNVANPGAILPRGPFAALFGNSSWINISIIITIIFAILVWVILQKTTFGYELKACGLSRDAAQYAGINSKRNIVLSMVISGALSGIGGGIYYLAGTGQYVLEKSILGMGFNGIPVALLASSNPIGTIFASLFISYIQVGGAAMQPAYSSETIDIVIAVIIYLAAFALLMRGIITKAVSGHKGKEGAAKMMIAANIISMTILFAVPLLLVAMGGMFSEHSGVINIALEGMMIIGALFACFTLQGLDQSGFGPAHPQLSMFIAILVAGVTGMIFSLLLGFAAINLKADQTIGGTALNQFAPAFAVVMTWAIQGQGLTTIFIPNWVRITRDTFGLAPVDGPSFWNNLIFKYFYLTTPVAIVLFIAAYIVMYKTRFGLRLRACGEHPQAADSVGINVYKMRYAGVLISGFLGGVGGLAYTLAAGSGFNSDVGGYGFLALAVMIFGNWKPLPILGASLFFALFKVIAALNATLTFLPKFEGVKEISNFYQMLPYIVTMIVLIFTSKNSQAPKAEGIPYDKGSR